MRLLVVLLLFAGLTRADVLIVADEIPAMKVLAAKLEAAEGVHSTIISQDETPADLAKYSAVIVYIHRALHEPPEKHSSLMPREADAWSCCITPSAPASVPTATGFPF